MVESTNDNSIHISSDSPVIILYPGANLQIKKLDKSCIV